MDKVMQRSVFQFSLAALLLIVSSCDREQPVRKQHSLETRSAGRIFSYLDHYEIIHPQTYPYIKPPNVAQVFAAMHPEAKYPPEPIYFQNEFLKLGKTTGFTNSYYEKYVPAPPFLTNRSVKRDPVFMSAQPYPDFGERWSRMVIWRRGPQEHTFSEVPEEEIQEIFRKAGAPIPTPAPMPPLPKPAPYYERNLSDLTITFFRNLAENIGLGRSLWFPVMIGSVTIFVIFVVFLSWFALRRKRAAE